MRTSIASKSPLPITCVQCFVLEDLTQISPIPLADADICSSIVAHGLALIDHGTKIVDCQYATNGTKIVDCQYAPTLAMGSIPKTKTPTGLEADPVEKEPARWVGTTFPAGRNLRSGSAIVGSGNGKGFAKTGGVRSTQGRHRQEARRARRGKRKVLSISSSSSSSSSSSETDEAFSCNHPRCNRSFETAGGLIKHKRTHTKKQENVPVEESDQAVLETSSAFRLTLRLEKY